MGRSEDNVSESARKGVEVLVARLLEASRQHDAAACAALFTENGVILSPYGTEARGRSAIESTHREWFEEGETNKRMELLEVGASGDVGYCILAYAGDYLQPDGSYSTESGKSVSVLKRQSSGEWKIHVSSLNSDKPPLA
ncbi:MAG: SgcJ/EcaC family oxidoreductase [Proteobacteria bacterium]|nr:MAG: SgcJ/EcaC family oxidoreductase [Pseudomonadota bacterium]